MSLPGIEPQYLSHPAYSHVTVATEPAPIPRVLTYIHAQRNNFSPFFVESRGLCRGDNECRGTQRRPVSGTKPTSADISVYTLVASSLRPMLRAG